jgi:hypothetical protein
MQLYVYPSGEEKLGCYLHGWCGAMLAIVLSAILQSTVFRKKKSITL